MSKFLYFIQTRNSKWKPNKENKIERKFQPKTKHLLNNFKTTIYICWALRRAKIFSRYIFFVYTKHVCLIRQIRDVKSIFSLSENFLYFYSLTSKPLEFQFSLARLFPQYNCTYYPFIFFLDMHKHKYRAQTNACIGTGNERENDFCDGSTKSHQTCEMLCYWTQLVFNSKCTL